MNIRTLASLVTLFITAIAASAADGWQTIDLRAFTNFSVFELRKPEWLLPRGRQVFDGVPFQVDGVVQVASLDFVPEFKDALRTTKPIPINQTFDQLHLLTAVVGNPPPESNTVARLRFAFRDGSNAVAELRLGDQFRSWNPALHKSETPLRDTNHAAVAWIVQCADTASADRYFRLYHVMVENPRPQSQVATVTFDTPLTNCGPVIAGLTLETGHAPRLTNTVNLPTNPFPDLRKRKGEPAVLAGVVRTWEGQPISNATVRVVAERGFSTQEYQSSRVSAQTNHQATTDGEGRFTLPPLPDNKIYHVVALAPAREPMFFNGADPKSEPVEFRLPEFKEVAGGYSVQVRVVDEQDRPVAGALVEKEGVRYNGGTSWGSDQEFAKFAVSDANGEFRFSRKEMFSALQMTITAPGFAPNKCWVDASNILRTVTLDVGATVRGRVVKDGQPLTNVTVGVSGVDRNSEAYVGHYTATTDTNGVFEFEHLPARKSWWLYGVMDSLKQYGAIKPKQLLSAAAGETNEVEDLEVVAGLRLAGKLQARHGEPLPGGATLYLSYDHWDSQTAKANTNGNFEFTGLVPGQVNVSVRQNKWRLSGLNRSLDDWGNQQLAGLLQQDKDDLLIVIEPGERDYNYNNSGGQLPPADAVRARLLFGAEKTGPYPITLAGQVLDDATGKPVRAFKVVPGRKPPVTAMGVMPAKPLLQQIAGAFRKPVTPWNELPWWDNVRSDTFSNGVFRVDFQPLTSTPMFRIEAEGFEGFVSEPSTTNSTNLIIRLTSGSGPGGVVFAPDGRPAPGATLWYAVAHEQAGLTDRTLDNYGGRERYKLTGADGRFAFVTRPEGRKLFVAHTNGWAELEVKLNDSNLKVQLAAWAVVKGTLVASNGTPMVGIPLHLIHPWDWNAGDPIVNMQNGSVTDAKGQFFFTNAMPVRLNLIREIRMGTSSGYSHGLQTWFICQPGITNDLGKVIFDSPPPPPFSEKVKRALGL